MHTSSYDKKTLNACESSLASEGAVKVGKLSSTTVEEAEGEVSVMSAANITCGTAKARVAKVLGPGDCCKVTSEDTVASIGGIATLEEAGSLSEKVMTKDSGMVKKAAALKENSITTDGYGDKKGTEVCTK